MANWETVHFLGSGILALQQNERFLKALEAKLRIPSPCLDSSKKKVFHWNLWHKKGSQLAMIRNPGKPSKWPKSARFPG